MRTVRSGWIDISWLSRHLLTESAFSIVKCPYSLKLILLFEIYQIYALCCNSSTKTHHTFYHNVKFLLSSASEASSGFFPVSVTNIYWSTDVQLCRPTLYATRIFRITACVTLLLILRCFIIWVIYGRYIGILHHKMSDQQHNYLEIYHSSKILQVRKSNF